MVTPTDSKAKDPTASNREDVMYMMTKIKWATPGQCKHSSTPEQNSSQQHEAKHTCYLLDKKTGKPVFEKAESTKDKDSVTLNGRTSTMQTIDELTHPEHAHPLVRAGLEKLQQDLTNFKGVFPNNYYEDFGRFMVMTAITLKDGKIGDAMEELWSTIDNEQWKHGSAIYHLYENLVRKNDNSGHDKLLHFLGSALWQCRSKGLLTEVMQYGKEVQDEIQKRLGDAKDGFDANDMRANRRGEALAETLEGCSPLNDMERKVGRLINEIEQNIQQEVMRHHFR